MDNETRPGNFVKILHLGTVPVGTWSRTRRAMVDYNRDVYCKVSYIDGKLSISGVVGPKSNGDAFGSCGQIVDELAHLSRLGEGWTADLVEKFRATWDRWHLNDMRAGCEHQRAEGWADRPIDPSKPTNTYGKHFEGQRCDSWNMLVWVSRTEHPEGLLSQPCPTCGYKYGTAWLREEVPADVLAFLQALPDSPHRPYWV